MTETLKNISLFYDIDDEVLKRLVNEGKIHKKFYHKGATVHEENQECGFLDVVCSGKLVAYSLASNGSETVVFEFAPDSVIGGNLLFGNPNRYPMNIYCSTEVVLLHISKSGVVELLKEYGFVMKFVQYLSINSQAMGRKIAMYTQKTLRENLMDYLLALSDEKNSLTIELPITKKQLADYFGVQRPSLFRELKRMKEEGLIEINNKKITIQFVNDLK